MNKIKIQEVIVVEGKDDTANLRRFYEVDTYETRGSAINQDDLERLLPYRSCVEYCLYGSGLQWGNGFVRSSCKKFRRPSMPFLNRGEAVPKSKTKGRSLGVEHASFEDLEKALAGLVGSYEDGHFFDITKSDLMRLGLLMGSDSRKRREYLGEALRIGYCNGKQLLKRWSCLGFVWHKLKKRWLVIKKRDRGGRWDCSTCLQIRKK